MAENAGDSRYGGMKLDKYFAFGAFIEIAGIAIGVWFGVYIERTSHECEITQKTYKENTTASLLERGFVHVDERISIMEDSKTGNLWKYKNGEWVEFERTK